MILEISDFLTGLEVSQLREIAAQSTFIDGKITNPHNKAKDNQQVDYGSEGHQKSNQILMNAISRNEQFRSFAFPLRVAPPMLCKYTDKQSYGNHSDVAFISIPQQAPLRSDISMTIFINDPEDYDGGELTLHLEDKPVGIKLAAGSAVIYPSTFIHEVTEVTRGERLVAISFAESRFRDERQRHLLYSLSEVEALEGFNIQHENRVRLAYIQQNLQRMWSS
jgi:PKHD-type hydroxylase